MNPLFDRFAEFAPTPEAAAERLARVDPTAYARTRNALDGAVSALSPYLTHGFVTAPQVLAGLRQRIEPGHRFHMELGWREYFHHVWSHRGDGIFDSLHPGPLPDAAYAPDLPADIRQAHTGVPVIDAAVRQLYGTGWLHNHARLWLASYVVHLRRVHWRAGADWLYGHLLDGDLASNHLSWQWVAGTASTKPYLFNAENVARHAGRFLPLLDSRGSGIDRPYEALDEIARGGATLGPEPGAGDAFEEPPLLGEPPADLLAALRPALPQDVAGRPVWLAHPWALATPPAGSVALALWQPAFHRRWPWSERRWRFVFTRLVQIAPLAWAGDPLPAPGVRLPASLHLLADGLPPQEAPARLFAAPSTLCTSFSQFWRRVGMPVGRP